MLRRVTVESVEYLLPRLAEVESVDHQVVQQLACLRRVLDARLVLNDVRDRVGVWVWVWVWVWGRVRARASLIPGSSCRLVYTHGCAHVMHVHTACTMHHVVMLCAT